MKNNFALLGVPLTSYTKDEIRKNIAKILGGKEFVQIATVNPEFLVVANKKKSFKEILHSTWNICDGAGIEYWSKLLYGKKIQRTTGVEIAEIICEEAVKQKKSVFLLGSYNPDMQKIAEKKFKGIQIAGTDIGKPTEALEKVKKAKPDIILVCYNFPLQEEWITSNADKIPNLKLAGGFGGTFDFWAGTIKRSPKWMQNIGIEWIWRLIQEPKIRIPRIWNAVFVFSWKVLVERLTGSQAQTK